MAIRDETKPIELSEDAEKGLVNRLKNMILEAEEFHSQWDDLHAEYQRAYRAQPSVEIKNWPWSRSSNLFVPLTRISVDTTAAMFFDAMFSTPPQIVGQRPEDDERAYLLSQFYFDFVWNGAILNLKEIGNDWNLDTLIDGTSAIKPILEDDLYIERDRIIENKLNTRKEFIEILGVTAEREIPVDTDQIIRERIQARPNVHPKIQIVDMTKLKVAPGTGPSLQSPDCAWYYEDTQWTEDDILARKRRSIFNPMEKWNYLNEALEYLKTTDLTERERDAREQEQLSQSVSPKSLDVKVFYATYTLPGTILLPDGTERTQRAGDSDGFPEEVIIWYIKDLDKISRIVPLSRVRPDGYRPHIDNRYRRIPRFFYGIGIPAALKQINELMNSAFNQMVDWGTLRNMPWAFYQPAALGINPDKLRLEPGALIPTLNPRAIEFPRFQGDNLHWLQVIQNAQAFAERITSVTDFTVGRAPSAPNAPRTFRGQAALLQQANVTFSYQVSLMAEAYRRMFQAVHVLYQRTAPEEIEFRYFNRNTGLFKTQKITRDDFRLDVDFEFRLNPNKLQTQQTLQTVFNMLLPLLSQTNNIAGIRFLSEQVTEAFGIKNFDSIWPREAPIQLQSPQQSGQQQPGQGQVNPNGGGTEFNPNIQQQSGGLGPNDIINALQGQGV